MNTPAELDSVEAAVEAIIAKLGNDIRIGLPLGLGKPVELVNALYARACADPGVQLTILTALSLERPQPGSDLEARFLQPFLDRVFEGCPELRYAQDQRAGKLPANVRVLEFFFKPGSMLGNGAAQRDYINSHQLFIALGVIGGVIAGAALGQPSIGFLAGLGIGVALAVLTWLMTR